MLLWQIWGNEEWTLYHKVTFDGENRQIIVNPGETDIDIKRDIYSAWKEWVQTKDYSKWVPAIRTIGGDPAGDGFAGDLYFMINDWQIVVDIPIDVNGILYSDDFPSPWVVEPGGGVVASVSNLAFAVATAAAEADCPSKEEIADEVMTRLQESLDLLTTLATEESVQKAIKSAKLAAALSA